jgi:hypothetical protein
MQDEIVETAMRLDVKPSFPMPRVLQTQIATNETFGIIPVPTSLAAKYGITTLPKPTIIALPHHGDVPLHALTRLSTTPTNQYRYIQLRQRTLFPVLPVHTHAEYVKFKEMISNTVYLMPSALGKPHAPHEAHKDIDYDRLANAWNAAVDSQSRALNHRLYDTTPGTATLEDGPATDSSDRIYYKIPTQLKNHHRKLLKHNSARATMLNGLNVKDLEPFMALINDSNMPLAQRKLPPGIPLEKDLSVNTRDGLSVALLSIQKY